MVREGCICKRDRWTGELEKINLECPVHRERVKFFNPDKPIAEAITEFTPDTIVQLIRTKFLLRAKKGKDKYGTDLDRKDLNIPEWIEHAQDELMDGILYLEKLKQELNANPGTQRT